jgi:hypothetical protein
MAEARLEDNSHRVGVHGKIGDRVRGQDGRNVIAIIYALPLLVQYRDKYLPKS